MDNAEVNSLIGTLKAEGFKVEKTKERYIKGTEVSYHKYLGYKFYKEIKDDEIDLIRITSVLDFDDSVIVKNLKTGVKRTMKIEDLKGYTPLDPFGFIMFTGVIVNTSRTTSQKDVIVSLYRYMDVRMDINVPYAICRQSITDFFYTLLSTGENNMVGVSATKDDCPTNIPYYMLAACDGVDKSYAVNFYYDDTIDTILDCLNTKYFDNILMKLYTDHINSLADAALISANLKSHYGWCKKLVTLLNENNFITDMDSIRNITGVAFDLSKYIYKNEKGYDVLSRDVLTFLSNTFKLNIIEAQAMKYDVDIDLAEFNNTNYTLIRDSKDILWVVVYRTEGEYTEDELLEKANELDVTTKLQLAFYNKYANLR